MDAVERKTRSFGEVLFFEIYASHSISASGYLPLMPFLHDRISHASKGNTRRFFNFLISAISTTPFHQLKHHDSISQPHLLPTLNDSASTIPFSARCSSFITRDNISDQIVRSRNLAWWVHIASRASAENYNISHARNSPVSQPSAPRHLFSRPVMRRHAIKKSIA